MHRSARAAQLENLVHLDRFERANLDANLATHADRNVDVEDRRIKLRFAHVIGLLVLALDDVDALRRAFLLANLAGDAAQTGLRIVVVENQERKIAVVLWQRNPLLRILHGDQPILLEITPDEISRRDRHALEYSGAKHLFIEALNVKNYSVLHLSVHFPHDDIDAAQNDHHVGDGVTETHVLENREVDETRRAHPIAIRIRAAVADQIKAELALGRFDSTVGFAGWRTKGADFHFRIHDRASGQFAPTPASES